MSVIARVVFDTNILFSAIGWNGKPSQCVEHARTGRIQGLTCVEILDELTEKLAAKLDFDDGEIEIAIGSLLGFLEVTAIAGLLRGPQTDRDDDKILECAVAGRATHIVTGDRKHLLPIRKYGDVEIVTAAELLELLTRVPYLEPPAGTS